jgi:hypothetical protein
MADANFGIVSRDVEVTDVIAEVKRKYDFPKYFGFNVAKNTSKHLIAIVERLIDVGLAPHFTLALQSSDEATLEAIERTNISTDHYVRLAAALRRRGLPLQADLMIGLPGQTVDSLAGDLQYLIDREVPTRMWITQLLPNAPINDPDYRKKWAVKTDDRGVVVSTSTFSEADRAEMMRIRHAYTVFEQYGLLRHVGRYLQWDHGVPFMTLLRRIVEVTRDDPERYPLLNFLMRYFDYYNVPPLGWDSFFAEVRRFVCREFDVAPSRVFDSVLALQAFLMPDVGRSFPDTLALDHDYLAYFRDHTAHVWCIEDDDEPRSLDEYPPGNFTVYADPLRSCSVRIRNVDDPRNENMIEHFWLGGHWELDSALVVSRADVAGSGSFLGLHEQIPDDLPDEVKPESRLPESVRVQLGKASS